MHRFPVLATCCAALLIAAALGLSACGSSGGSGDNASKLSLSIAESGKTAKFTAPKAAKGGLVTVTLKNSGKQPHSAQLALVQGNHTAAQALKIVSSNSNKTPSWLRAEGGVSAVPPGQSGTATLNLPGGKYVLTELGGPGSSGPPASTQIQFRSGKTGTLPGTPTTITADNPSKDHYKWDISGTLKPGVNKITFDSKGKQALHFIGAFRVTGNPSKAAILKALKTNGKPPSFVDLSSFYDTAAIDGGKSQTSELLLQKPGKYVLFCPLTDRDGGKPHFAEGLLTTVTVK